MTASIRYKISRGPTRSTPGRPAPRHRLTPKMTLNGVSPARRKCVKSALRNSPARRASLACAPCTTLPPSKIACAQQINVEPAQYSCATGERLSSTRSCANGSTKSSMPAGASKSVPRCAAARGSPGHGHHLARLGKLLAEG